MSKMRTLYRRLALASHPDKGGSKRIFQVINGIHDDLFSEGGRRRTPKASARTRKRANKAKRNTRRKGRAVL